ncbi:YolD-like family protein [Sporosarcina gallistercoris]|uniref:YolD-like family protein n=1 Tax=Sporosarcina gallistercoris TaxID=2762245 RepID=A0ABR8PNA3_9BACL|nr:YolD-like family protein [Sporosarcina gallistercoris]MBD7909638.1 YolD-like family protein [Sporosarcina gallistercoris]
MTAIPKPAKAKKAASARPQLTEYDYQEIGEKLKDAQEFESEVEITIFHRKQHERFVGVISSADGQTGVLSLRVGYEDVKINMNDIVGIE